MLGKEATFPIRKGQRLVLWRTYEELGYMVDLIIASGEGAIGQFNDYTFENGGNVISASQDGLWTLQKYAVGEKKSLYVRIKEEKQNNRAYGEYVAWSTLIVDNYLVEVNSLNERMRLDSNGNLHITAQSLMQCRYCGGITNDVDNEYLAGTDHLECVLKDYKAIMNGTTC